MRFHHVQLAIPVGAEDRAREFYAVALGLTEVDKPVELAGRGGCWFRSAADGGPGVELHLGVEEPFVPARKAHPGIMLDGIQELALLAERIAHAGFEVDWRERKTFAGYERFHCRDPFGNRLEVLAAV